MAKRITKFIPLKYKQKLLTAAGIFAAGSLVGSTMEIPPMSAYFEILSPESTEIRETDRLPEETPPPLSFEPESPSVPPETEPVPSVPAPSVPAVPAAPAPVPEAVPEPLPSPEENPVPAPVPDTPAVTPDSLPESVQDSDWMEGIFVPAAPVPEVPDSADNDWNDWMESLWPTTPEPSVTPPSVTPPSPTSASSMTQELAALLENIAVFWSNADNKIHLDPSCTAASAVFAGTVEEAQTVRPDGWCRRCAEHLDGTDNSVFYVKGNAWADADALADSYTYQDYQNRIPADAFGG